MSSPISPLNLILESDNPYNTNMYDEKDGRILYQVMTEYQPETVTRVRNVDGETIASWQWKDPKPDIIILGNGNPVPLGTWLKKSIMPFKDAVTFQDQIGRHFKWKGWGTGTPLELFSEDDKKYPIAYFVKSHPLPHTQAEVWNASSSPHWAQARLLVDRRGQEILDLVVISFLVLEKSRRAENSTTHRAESITGLHS
ncbi:hypothetical protein J3R30DRAFT_3656941 [Lentinula aciculospora]|uniref:DUF6593 domain-containing protein n=1 Tax=Lentinula aciculospora TaxID=153920 RepID=A0A9W9DQG1_9AGAR|nr:hypothetical protein J3R30DRAFT_3656941 [Lentinula aciculospora]